MDTLKTSTEKLQIFPVLLNLSSIRQTGQHNFHRVNGTLTRDLTHTSSTYFQQKTPSDSYPAVISVRDHAKFKNKSTHNFNDYETRYTTTSFCQERHLLELCGIE